MSRNWKDVRDELMAECDRVWFDEPDYVTMVNNSFFPSGAGVGKIVMGNRFNLTYWMHITSYGTLYPTINKAIANPEFTLDQCKKVFTTLLGPTAQIVGGVHEPQCKYPWLNQGMFKKFYDDIVDSFDSITDKETLHYMVWLFCGCYSRCLSTYFQNAFPWYFGPRRVDADFLATASRLLENKANTF